ncbi:CoB--CoM heterodisulfide reductase iron-sulfur subunit A family protein [Candidatus Thorarchaeota archaeon]|nr:MAG: CoB--CoM heterodisulfide reductase iron-sulfur subunit A family protein [Candidatus Thorarchaeota archaeon]
MSDDAEPRIGVFVCHCGHNIAGTVDVVSVAEMAQDLPYVVYSTDDMFMCADSGQQLIKDKVAEHNLNRVVVASCSPRMHEPTFRRVVEEAGLNRYLFEQVNLREHVSWCHMREPEAATEKAKDLVRMSVARAAKLESLPIKSVSVTPRTLVVGGGVTGMHTALDIADRGFDVVLVEREPDLGGHVKKWHSLYPTGRSGEEIVDELSERILKHKRIKVYTNSEVVGFDGYIGNFEVTIKNKDTNKEEKLDIGTAVIATGFKSFKPEGYYGYDWSPDIVTLAELEEMKTDGDLKRPSDGRPVKKIAMIGCVGSREPDTKGHEHCSRYCCTAVANTASQLRDELDEVVILYQDIRTYGKNHEEIHRQSRGKHVIYSKFPTDEKPVVHYKDGQITITWTDVLSGDRLEFFPDMVVLASAMLPAEGTQEVAKLFSLTRSPDGFFNPEHIKLAPLTTHTAGVMIAGTAQAAKGASESIVDASGAAAKAVALMARGEVEIESTVSHVIEDLCSSCHTCVSACPYGAIAIDQTKEPAVAKVTEAKCHGCGTCAAACPSGAIIMRHSTDEQILTMVEAYLCPEQLVEGGAK